MSFSIVIWKKLFFALVFYNLYLIKHIITFFSSLQEFGVVEVDFTRKSMMSSQIFDETFCRNL